MILLVRHAQAVDSGEFAGTDAERPLTDKGRRRFERVAAALDGEVDSIFSSTLVRAQQTADLLADTNSAGRPKIVDWLAPDTNPEQAAKEILSRCAKYRTVAFVSHEPLVSDLASRLGAARILDFKKGMVVAICRPASGYGRVFKLAITPGGREVTDIADLE